MSPTSFRVFDSRLAIQASLPLICKYQHAAAEHWFVFLPLLFLLSVPAGSWSYKCLYREALMCAKPLSPLAQTTVFTHAANHKRPIQGAQIFCFTSGFPSCFSVLNTGGGKRVSSGKTTSKIHSFVCKKMLKEFIMRAHTGDFVYFRDINKFSHKMIL